MTRKTDIRVPPSYRSPIRRLAFEAGYVRGLADRLRESIGTACVLSGVSRLAACVGAPAGATETAAAIFLPELATGMARALVEHDDEPCSSLAGKLDPGVRWFVDALNAHGASTECSCDGHGDRWAWYVTFHAPIAVAERISRLGFLVVELCADLDRPAIWRLRLGTRDPDGPNTPIDKFLAMVRAAWIDGGITPEKRKGVQR